jgi:drug/metabolite transporter (DMT)-like permease
MKKNVLLGAFLCFIASVSWGAMFPVTNDAFNHMDPFYFTIFRYGSVTIILIIMLLWKEGIQAFRLEGKGFALWFFGTMAFVIYNILIFWGQDLLGGPGVMIASVGESLMPMISIVIIWMLYRNRPHVFTLLCVIVAFIGASFVTTKGDFGGFFGSTADIIPSLLILLAVIGWVIYTMGGKEFAGWSALRYSTLSCILGTATAMMIVFAVTLTGYVSVPTVETIKIVSPHLAFMIIFPGVIALVGWNVGVSILSPLNGLLFINFVPVTTLTIRIFQGQPITSYEYIGTIFIILSLMSNNMFLRMQQKKNEPKHFKGKLQESVS